MIGAEADLEGCLDDGGFLGRGRGRVKGAEGAVEEGEGDVVDVGGAIQGEGGEAAAGVDEGVVSGVAFGEVGLILEV